MGGRVVVTTSIYELFIVKNFNLFSQTKTNSFLEQHKLRFGNYAAGVKGHMIPTRVARFGIIRLGHPAVGRYSRSTLPYATLECQPEREGERDRKVLLDIRPQRRGFQCRRRKTDAPKAYTEGAGPGPV